MKALAAFVDHTEFLLDLERPEVSPDADGLVGLRLKVRGAQTLLVGQIYSRACAADRARAAIICLCASAHLTNEP